MPKWMVEFDGQPAGLQDLVDSLSSFYGEEIEVVTHVMTSNPAIARAVQEYYEEQKEETK